MEVVLRVKHGSNLRFSFLFPGDILYPYYRWMVEHNPQELVRAAAPGGDATAAAAAHATAGFAQDATALFPASKGATDTGGGTTQDSVGVGVATAAADSSPAADGGSSSALELLRQYSAVSESSQEGDVDVGNAAPGPQDGLAGVMYGPGLPSSQQPALQPGGAIATAIVQPTSTVYEDDDDHISEPAPPGLEELPPGDLSAPAPPRDVKAIVDKLVDFVDRNGVKFEVGETGETGLCDVVLWFVSA